MTSRKKRTQVLVAGAGPAGLVSALLLSRRGVDVHIVDQAWRAAGRSYAAALHPGTLALLDDLGIVGEVMGAGHRVDRMAFYEASERRSLVNLAQLGGKFPFLVVLPQSTLEGLLERELSRRGVTVHWLERVASVTQGEQFVTTEVDVLESASSGYAVASSSLEVARTVAIESDFLIGADGYRSMVRRTQNFVYESWGEPEVFDVFEFDSDDVGAGEVRVVLDKDTTNVLWPLPNGRQRFSFQVRDPRTPERHREKSRLAMAIPGESSPRYSAELLERLVRQRAPWFDSRLGDIAWAGDVVFERRLATRLGDRGVWLVGDAAHQTGPVGVQSMNAGLLEAAQLAQAVAGIISGESTPSSLATYEAHTLKAWWQLLGRQDLWHGGPRVAAWIDSRKDRILSCLPGSCTPVVRKQFSGMADQLGLYMDEPT